MKTFSARQLELDYSIAGEADPVENLGGKGEAATSLSLPEFAKVDPANAVAARLAGRANALQISESDHREFVRERARLINKKLVGEATKRELNRLEYVQWTLDRIEDAKFGQSLEALDDYARQYENFLSEIEELRARLDGHLKSRKSKKATR